MRKELAYFSKYDKTRINIGDKYCTQKLNTEAVKVDIECLKYDVTAISREHPEEDAKDIRCPYYFYVRSFYTFELDKLSATLTGIVVPYVVSHARLNATLRFFIPMAFIDTCIRKNLGLCSISNDTIAFDYYPGLVQLFRPLFYSISDTSNNRITAEPKFSLQRFM